ncbi:MAG: transketolase [Phascolarctobacterium sp.]|nr:transketolase [Phascolarctobacterium sp.]
MNQYNLPVAALQVKANKIRQHVLDIIRDGGAGHIGGDFSEADFLTAIYYHYLNMSPDMQKDPDRDRFVLSKGHCVETLYAILADQGYITSESLKTYQGLGSPYIGHPNNKVPGIEMNTGSLGHGLAVATGMALAGKMDGKNYHTYVVMGDGETDEGSVWEAAIAAAHYKLGNLIGILDRNNLQISGPTETVMAHGDLQAKYEAFGWRVIDLENANDMQAICEALDKAIVPDEAGKPTIIIAHTIKGFGGGPLMENKASWHHHLPNAEEYAAIKSYLKAGEVNG